MSTGLRTATGKGRGRPRTCREKVETQMSTINGKQNTEAANMSLPHPKLSSKTGCFPSYEGYEGHRCRIEVEFRSDIKAI